MYDEYLCLRLHTAKFLGWFRYSRDFRCRTLGQKPQGLRVLYEPSLWLEPCGCPSSTPRLFPRAFSSLRSVEVQDPPHGESQFVAAHQSTSSKAPLVRSNDIQPRGSKYPIFEAAGSKIISMVFGMNFCRQHHKGTDEGARGKRQVVKAVSISKMCCLAVINRAGKLYRLMVFDQKPHKLGTWTLWASQGSGEVLRYVT